MLAFFWELHISQTYLNVDCCSIPVADIVSPCCGQRSNVEQELTRSEYRKSFSNVSNYAAYYVMKNSEGSRVFGMFSGRREDGRGAHQKGGGLR